MFVCEQNSSCIGCNYQYADSIYDIDEEFRDCSRLIEVAEVRYSTWVFSGGYITCKKCGCQPYKHSHRIDFDGLWQYCPRCGAIMDYDKTIV